MSNIPKKPKNKIGARRWNLWMEDPHCHWCRKELSWRQSTVDHLNSKVKQEKREYVRFPNTVLSCGPCNQKRATQERLEMPRWFWWYRSRMFPRVTRLDLTLKERFIIIYYRNILGMQAER